MDQLFDGRSAQHKSTLFYLKIVFYQRPVSELFNYVKDFLAFTTKGYIILFGINGL